MKISVAICSLVKPELFECVESIKKQTRKPDEIIIVTNKITKIPGTKVLIQNGVGLPNARNCALKVIKGDIVCFFDDDTTLDKNYLREVEKVFKEKANCGGVTGRITNIKLHKFQKGIVYKLINTYGKIFGISGFFANLEGIRVLPSGFITSDFYSGKELKKIDWLSGCNMCYSKKAIQKTGKFDEGFGKVWFFEDADYSYRVKKEGFDIYFNPKAKLEHNLSKTNRLKLAKSKNTLLLAHKKFFYKNVHEGKITRHLKFHISRIGLFPLVLTFSVIDKNPALLKGYLLAMLGD